ncbi:MAG: sigma-54 dependent transcriptional [Planctomycetota bacterium]|nr:MAG: sigma-54 dependent transcriptional [Planctomycetota bacterium]
MLREMETGDGSQAMSAPEPCADLQIALELEELGRISRAPYIAFLHRPKSGRIIGPLVHVREGAKEPAVPKSLIDEVFRTGHGMRPRWTPRTTRPIPSRTRPVPPGLLIMPFRFEAGTIAVLCIAGAPWLFRMRPHRLNRVETGYHLIREVLQGPPRAYRSVPTLVDGRVVRKLVEIGASLPAPRPRPPAGDDPCSKILGTSEARQKLVSRVHQLGETRVDAVITGESGSGKEIVARAIHQCSNRRRKPFVAVNCGALAEKLLETELFGCEAGAYTDATKDRKGKFEAADGGTLFLDEIADASSDLQKKLLRVLQEKSFTPVGSTKEIPTNVRVLFATNRNLEEEVCSGHFRADLYYRIQASRVVVPSLSERREDIGLIVASRLAGIAREVRAEWEHEPVIEQAALDLLAAADWPGSIRELLGFVKNALATLGWKLTCDGIGGLLKGRLTPGPTPAEKARLEEIRELDEAFAIAAGVLAAAARYLGITPRGLALKLTRLQHDPRKNGTCSRHPPNGRLRLKR